jgi:chemotaxis protein methyltransferase CheR
MSPDDITLLVSLCRARAGLKISPEKTYLIESRLNPVARRESYTSIPDMLAAVRAKRDETLIWAIVEAMASGESSFFGDRSTYALLRDEILPALSRARSGRPVRLWSAACGSGQEIYSAAMIAHDLAEQGVAVELAASDLSERMLEQAQSGLYTQFEVQRGLPIRRLVQHFAKEGDLWRLSPQIRQKVRWRRINLIAGLKGLGPFDVVLCRNVLSGMAPPAREQVIAEMVQVMPADGVLILAARESVEVGPAFLPVGRAPGVHVRNPDYRAQAA